jgi:hypothetical protein
MSGILCGVKANSRFVSESEGSLHQSQKERLAEAATGILVEIRRDLL